MRKVRVYQQISLSENTEVLLNREASNHLCNVLRLKVGYTLYIFNGDGNDYEAKVVSADKRATRLQLFNAIAVNIESPLQIHLGQGISRGDRMDYAIQKAVELGVTCISPIITEYCSVKQKIIESKQEHWEKIIISACEQSGRAILPKLNDPIMLSVWLEKQTETTRLVLSPEGDARLQQLSHISPSIALLIGPEGGLSEQEVSHCLQHNFTNIGLGPRILRTETAASGSIAVIQALFGDG